MYKLILRKKNSKYMAKNTGDIFWDKTRIIFDK